jgi:hypothetical protein
MNTNLASQIAGAIPPNADLRAIKPPVEIPTGWLWFWVALVFVLPGPWSGGCRLAGGSGA